MKMQYNCFKLQWIQEKKSKATFQKKFYLFENKVKKKPQISTQHT